MGDLEAKTTEERGTVGSERTLASYQQSGQVPTPPKESTYKDKGKGENKKGKKGEGKVRKKEADLVIGTTKRKARHTPGKQKPKRTRYTTEGKERKRKERAKDKGKEKGEKKWKKKR
eukprot:Phypoly_transcript_17106.p3 GENE.Phypoly_transcript_17106~~Phypoly_transcript_17106.p3  ORF type:complete len:117 (+),score=37.68 Phypoly_transcript_17106:455-805(+)